METNSVYPKEMMVSNDGEKWSKRMVHGRLEYNGKFVASILGDKNPNYLTQNTRLKSWKYGKDIIKE